MGVPSERVASQWMRHCIELVRRHDYESYLCALLLPAAARRNVIVVRALNVELSLVRERIERGSGVADINRLKFWRGAIESVYDLAPGPIPRQPAVQALSEIADRSLVPASALLSLVDARLDSLGDRPFDTVDAMLEYGERTHGCIIGIALSCVCAGREPTAPASEAAKCIARSLGVTQLLRSTVYLASRGVVLLPADVMHAAQLTPADVVTGRHSDRLRTVAGTLAAAAKRHLHTARKLRSRIGRSERLALLPAISSDCVLSNLAASGNDPTSPLVQSGGTAKLPWLLLYRRLLARY